jgi:hypothetical protein
MAADRNYDLVSDEIIGAALRIDEWIVIKA